MVMRRDVQKAAPAVVSADRDVYMPPMLFFQKPDIGMYGPPTLRNNAVEENNKDPIQVAFASGGFGIGISTSSKRTRGQELGLGSEVMVASEPENFDIDILERRGIIYSFLFVASVNIILTSLMYHYASVMDLSSSVPRSAAAVHDVPYAGAVFVFEEVPDERRYIEDVSFYCLLVATILGAVSALVESPLGLSAYALCCALNFILGASALPYFLFAFRYAFDLWLLYLALLLRSKLVMCFLNMQIHNHD